MKLSYAIPEPEPMLATPESVDSSSASPESGVLAAEVFVLEPSLCNENSPARKIKSVFQRTKLKNYAHYKFLVKTHFHTSRFEIVITVPYNAFITNYMHRILYYFIFQ